MSHSVVDTLPHETSSQRRPITDTQPLTIEPSNGWQLINFAELWRYHELLYFLVLRDVTVRYKQTLLGAAWAILQPVMMMIVFTVVLGQIDGVSSGEFPYPLFVFTGLLPWMFFASAITNAANSVVGSEAMLTKIYFPRLALPIASVGVAIIDFCVAAVVLLGLMAWYGIRPGPTLLLAPIVFGLLTLLTVGAGTLLAALNVAYRDFRHVLPFLMQFWMFATPSIYMANSARGDAESTVEAAATMSPEQSKSAPPPADRSARGPGFAPGWGAPSS